MPNPRIAELQAQAERLEALSERAADRGESGRADVLAQLAAQRAWEAHQLERFEEAPE